MANLWSDELVEYISRTTQPIFLDNEFGMTFNTVKRRNLDNGDLFNIGFYDEDVGSGTEYFNIQLKDLTGNYALYLGVSNISCRQTIRNRTAEMKVDLYQGLNFNDGTGSLNNFSVYNANLESTKTPKFDVEYDPNLIGSSSAILLATWYPDCCIQLSDYIRLDTSMIGGNYQNYTLKITIPFGSSPMSYGGNIWIAQAQYII